MHTETVSGPTVSVVIPVYNAGEHLEECLRSIADQSLGFEHLEIVAVDDASTDDSADLLDAWAARHPGRVRVVRLAENTGAPGGPRNRGIEEATGEFLFFADPDDRLGTEALERMVGAARRDDSDVVLGRIRGVGRKAPVTPFRKNVAGGDLFSCKAVWTLTAHKLFRRSLVEEHRLRFAEGVRLAEEQMFVVPAYLHARSMSVVADYDCYHLIHRDGFPHLTREVPDPAVFYANLRNVLDVVVAHVPPGSRRNGLLYRWLTLEILGRFKEPFAELPDEARTLHVKLAGQLLREYVPQELVAELPPLSRLRCLLLTEGAVEEITALCALVPRPRPAPEPEAPAPVPHAAPRLRGRIRALTVALAARTRPAAGKGGR
ncbi:MULTISPECIES: glycosyltransferase family 2 protein [unclassified Streptomyces]|uniref:glycosyltransferase family 2 protein n=1 Tax=unclassified Streptomyces TaxID=2593676 RepID=UPI001F0C53DD|nr:MULTISPECIES: glycosyltransferase family 2 protein [unclassified Streptomyces]